MARAPVPSAAFSAVLVGFGDSALLPAASPARATRSIRCLASIVRGPPAFQPLASGQPTARCTPCSNSDRTARLPWLRCSPSRPWSVGGLDSTLWRRLRRRARRRGDRSGPPRATHAVDGTDAPAPGRRPFGQRSSCSSGSAPRRPFGQSRFPFDGTCVRCCAALATGHWSQPLADREDRHADVLVTRGLRGRGRLGLQADRGGRDRRGRLRRHGAEGPGEPAHADHELAAVRREVRRHHVGRLPRARRVRVPPQRRRQLLRRAHRRRQRRRRQRRAVAAPGPHRRHGGARPRAGAGRQRHDDRGDGAAGGIARGDRAGRRHQGRPARGARGRAAVGPRQHRQHAQPLAAGARRARPGAQPARGPAVRDHVAQRRRAGPRRRDAGPPQPRRVHRRQRRPHRLRRPGDDPRRHDGRASPTPWPPTRRASSTSRG